MKIQPLKTNNINSSPNIRSYRQTPDFKPSFKGFFDVFIKTKPLASKEVAQSYTKRPNPKDLTEEESRSEEMKGFLKKIYDAYNEAQADARTALSSLKNILKYAQKVNGQGMYVYDEVQNIKFYYSNFDEKINAPRNITRWEMGRVSASYEILSTEPSYTYNITKYMPNGVKTIYHMKDSEIISLEQEKSREQSYLKYTKKPEGFDFIFRDLDSETKNDEFDTKIEFDFQDIKNCIFTKNYGNVIIPYNFSPEYDMWEANTFDMEVKSISSDIKAFQNPCFVQRTNQDNLTQEEQSSEAIKEISSNWIERFKNYLAQDSTIYHLFAILIDILEKTPNLSHVTIGDIQYTFEDFDIDDIPSKISAKIGDSLVAQYEITSIFPDFEYTYSQSDEQGEAQYSMTNNKMHSFRERDFQNNTEKIFTSDDKGFEYTLITQDENAQKKISAQITLKEGSKPKFYANLENEDETYIYDEASDIWKLAR